MNLFTSIVSSPLAAAGLRWWVESTLSVSLLFGVAALAHVALRGAGAAWRHLLWAATLTAALIVPVVSAVGPRLALPGVHAPDWLAAPAPSDAASSARTGSAAEVAETPNAASPGAAETGAASLSASGAQTPSTAADVPSRSEGGAVAGERAPVSADEAPTVTPTPSASDEARPSLAGRALAVWCLGAFVVLVPLSLAGVGLRRMARRAERVRDAEWLVLAEEAAHEIGLERPFVLLESDDVEVPMTWGLASPRVVLPRSASAWTVERRRAVLMHELAHIKRHDCLSQCVAQVACAVYWFHPAAWMAARQLRVERERACDDLVLLSRTRPSDYADHLLDVVRELRATGPSPLGAVAFARPSQFEGRLLAVLDPRRRRDALSGAQALRLGVVALVMAAGFATLRPWQSSADNVNGMHTGIQRSVWVHGAVGNASGVREPSTVIVAPAGAGSLEKRWQWAMDEVERRGISGSFWVGYALPKRSEPNRGYATDTRGFSWDMLDENDDGLKLGEALQRAGSTPDPQDVAMLFRVPGVADPSKANRLRAQNVTFGCELEKRPLLWLGDVADDESAAWIMGFEQRLEDDDLREGALNMLGLHRAEDRVAPLLTRYARGDGSIELRKNAVETLSRFPTATTQATLVDLARRDASSEVRREAVEALGRMGRSDAADELVRIARDVHTSDEVRRQAIESLERHIDDSESGIPDGVQFNPNKGPKTKSKGKVYGEMSVQIVEPDGDVLEPVEPHSKKAKSKPSGSWWNVARSADPSVDPEDPADEADADASDEDTDVEAGQLDVQRQAVESIGRFPANVAIPRLRSILNSDAHPELRRQAIEALGRMEEPEARQLVVDAVWKDRNDDVMREAVDQLSRQGDAAAPFLLEVVKKHPHVDVRRNAVEDFRHMTAGVAVPRLDRLIQESGDPEVQRQAVETMARFGGDDVVSRLQDVIRHHPNGEVRRQAVESLSRMDPALALPVLEELLKSRRSKP